MNLTAITCTGDRPEAFRLCERWVSRQTRQPERWIVVDDGVEPTRCTMGQQVIRLEPMPGHSLTRNMRAALSCVDVGAVACIEDDDWYGPGWMEWAAAALTDFPIVGEGHAVYYHVGRRIHCTHRNDKHASLCSTVVREDLFPLLLQMCEGDDPFIDTRLWRFSGHRPTRFPTPDDPPMVVGIKGMPGRFGIGLGHKPDRMRNSMPDPDLSFLRCLIGGDADEYARYAW
jgi:hypothetical protein